MVDLKEIDLVFNKKMPLEKTERKVRDKRTRTLRFAKLMMPSLAALLIALIVVAPNLKKNNVIAEYDITTPKKGELEKLHVEDTTFSISDKDGKVSLFSADYMDETEAGSKIVKIINPKGTIPLQEENHFVKVSAKIGFFNQLESYVRLEEKVRAVYDEKTTIETEQAEYDFKKAYGQGNKQLYAYGEWGKLWADGFSYDKKNDVLYLQRKSKLLHDESVLRAFKQTRYYKSLNKIEAEGNVILDHEKSRLFADKVVMLLEGKDLKIKKIEAFGHVRVETEGAVAKGNYGVYEPLQNEIRLKEQVSIEKDGNIVYGDEMVTNLKTKISRMVTTEKNKRVSGVIRGTSIKRKK